MGITYCCEAIRCSSGMLLSHLICWIRFQHESTSWGNTILYHATFAIKYVEAVSDTSSPQCFLRVYSLLALFEMCVAKMCLVRSLLSLLLQGAGLPVSWATPPLGDHTQKHKKIISQQSILPCLVTSLEQCNCMTRKKIFKDAFCGMQLYCESTYRFSRGKSERRVVIF